MKNEKIIIIDHHTSASRSITSLIRTNKGYNNIEWKWGRKWGQCARKITATLKIPHHFNTIHAYLIYGNVNWLKHQF